MAGLARAFANQGVRVLAIDADPASNLTQALGFSPDQRLTPIAEMKDLIAERTGIQTRFHGRDFSSSTPGWMTSRKNISWRGTGSA